MKYKASNDGNKLLSTIGFGGWGIGGEYPNLRAYGPKDDAVSITAIQRAYRLGVTFFDTSNSYGNGHSEEILGIALSQCDRSKYFLASKFGYLEIFSPTGVNQDFSPEAIACSLEKTLTRLQTNYLDLYQVHDCPIGMLKAETFEALTKLKRHRVIRAIGFAGKSPDDTLKAIQQFPFDMVQVNFNLTDMRAWENGLLDACWEKKIGIIARTPLVFGFLTGKIDAHTIFALSDHRNRFSYEQKQKWSSAVELFSEPFAHLSLSPTQRALTFCRSFPQITVVNCGMSTPAHVVENVSDTDVSLCSPSILKQCLKIYQREYKSLI